MSVIILSYANVAFKSVFLYQIFYYFFYYFYFYFFGLSCNWVIKSGWMVHINIHSSVRHKSHSLLNVMWWFGPKPILELCLESSLIEIQTCYGTTNELSMINSLSVTIVNYAIAILLLNVMDFILGPKMWLKSQGKVVRFS